MVYVERGPDAREKHTVSTGTLGTKIKGRPVLEHLAFGVLHCMGLPNVKPVEDVLDILMQEGG